jgi:hypothetical protein
MRDDSDKPSHDTFGLVAELPKDRYLAGAAVAAVLLWISYANGWIERVGRLVLLTVLLLVVGAIRATRGRRTA